MKDKDKYFIRESQVEREKILKIVENNDLKLRKLTPINSYAEYDASILSGDNQTILILETKVRNKKWNQFPTAIIDTEKVDKLVEIANKYQKISDMNGYNYKIVPYYIAVYQDKALGWVITGKEDKNIMNAHYHTANNSNSKNKLVPKWFSHFEISKAKKFKLNDK